MPKQGLLSSDVAERFKVPYPEFPDLLKNEIHTHISQTCALHKEGLCQTLQAAEALMVLG